jgi:hypothetical protein
MRWEHQTNSSTRIVLALLMGVCLATVFGCAHTINPFVDDTASLQDATNASERSVREADRAPVIRRREWEQSDTVYASGAVIHWPLWFEDPFEDKGSEDGQFAWTAEDYIAWPYSFGRFLLNTMAWPVSAVVTPPGTPMVSDGRLSRQVLGMDHDAIPLSKVERRTDYVNPNEEVDADSENMAEGPDPLDGVEDEGPPYSEQVSRSE